MDGNRRLLLLLPTMLLTGKHVLLIANERTKGRKSAATPRAFISAVVLCT
jgi:hypothetical protein